MSSDERAVLQSDADRLRLALDKVSNHLQRISQELYLLEMRLKPAGVKPAGLSN